MSGVTISVQAAHTRYSARSSSAWIESTELAAMAFWMAEGLPPRPAWAVAAAPRIPAPHTMAMAIFCTSFMLRPSRRVTGGFFPVLAEEELTPHVDVQDEQIV